MNILPKESVVHAQALAALETLCGQAETKIEALRRRRKLLEDLGADTRQTRSSREPARFEELQRRFAGAGLTPLEWESFRMAFVGKVDTVVALAIQTVDQAILFAIEGNPSKPISPSATPSTDWPLNALKVARDAKKQLVGIDAARRKEIRRASAGACTAGRRGTNWKRIRIPARARQNGGKRSWKGDVRSIERSSSLSSKRKYP